MRSLIMRTQGVRTCTITLLFDYEEISDQGYNCDCIAYEVLHVYITICWRYLPMQMWTRSGDMIQQ